MKAEAVANAESDKKEREVVDAVNKGDSIVFSQEKMLEEQNGNLTDSEKTAIEGLVSQMKDAVKAKDVAKINELETSINAKWNEVSQRVYGQQQQQTTQQQAEQQSEEDIATSATDENIQDADFEEVN